MIVYIVLSLLMSACNLINAGHHTYIRYKIDVELPFLKEDYKPCFSSFYKGQYFKSNGCIEIILPSQEKEFYLLVTQAPEIPLTPDIHTLKTKKHHLHRLWRIYSSYEHDENNNAHLLWSAQEVMSKKDVIEIPDNTVILHWDNPQDIISLKESKSSCAGPLLCLPVIQFNKGLSLEEFKKKELYMHAASLDLKCIHASFCSTTKVNELAHQTISIPTPVSRL